ncbi:hypothetical protein MTO96_025256 [Rhipicephalus appendiculatus]
MISRHSTAADHDIAQVPVQQSAGRPVDGCRAQRQVSRERRPGAAGREGPAVAGDPAWSTYAASIPRAQSYKGVLLQGYLLHPHVIRGLADFKIRNDDVFIVTYPKSGTTWMEEIVSLIMNGGDPDRVKNKLLVYRVQHLEVGPPVGHLWHLRKTRSPRLLATHLPLKLIPKQLQQAKCKIIYVVRNPKDNAVSYYHHHKMSTFLGNFKGSWDEFLEHYMSGHVVYGSWFDHVLPYWKFHLERPDRVMFVSFEELKIELGSMVQRISPMKNNNMVNREVLPISDLFDMTQSKFMRKGIIGDWKNYFTPEQSESFDQQYAERMADSGLDLVFEPQDALDRMRKFGRIIVDPEPKMSWARRDGTDSNANNEEDKEADNSGKRPVPVLLRLAATAASPRGGATPPFHDARPADAHGLGGDVARIGASFRREQHELLGLAAVSGSAADECLFASAETCGSECVQRLSRTSECR